MASRTQNGMIYKYYRKFNDIAGQTNFVTGNKSYRIESSENEIQSDKSGKMTAGPIITLGFQDRLSGIALSFDFVNFVKKNLFDLPSRPCLVSGHV